MHDSPDHRAADQSGPSAGRVAPEPMLIPDTAAAALCGISRASWHRLRAAGKVPPPVRLGRAVRWRRDLVIAWIAAGCPDMEAWQAMQEARERRLARVV